MKNIRKDRILMSRNGQLFALGILAISAFVIASVPSTARAQYNTVNRILSNTFNNHSSFNSNYDYSNYQNPYYNNSNYYQGQQYVYNNSSYQNTYTNPSPYVNTITPNSTTAGAEGAVITINGNGFVPTSVAQFDGTNYPTTYVSSTELRIQLSSAAVSKAGRYYVSVSNPAPGGGFSNPVPFTIQSAPAPVTSSTYNYSNTPNNTSGTSNNTSSYSYTSSNNTSSNNSSYGSNSSLGASAGSAYMNAYPYQGTNYTDTTGENYANLTGNAIFGTDSFFPTGVIQWIIFAVLVVAIVFIWRRFFGSTSRYHSTPLKHA